MGTNNGGHHTIFPSLRYFPSNILFYTLILGRKNKYKLSLIFRHRASSIQDGRFATLQRTFFIYLINKYISLSDIYLTVHH